MRALIVIAGVLALAGIASAAAAQPTTIVHSKVPIAAVAQDGGFLAWLSGDGTRCNTIHMTGGGNTYILPQPPNSSLTCRWNLAAGTQRLAIASDASAALWTLHEHGSDYVLTAQVGGKEIKIDQLAHQSDGTRWWLGGITGGGSTLAYSMVDVEYVDPLGCGSSGSCAKKIAGGKVELVSGGQKSALPNSGPALALALSGGLIAYIPATAVSKSGAPVPSPSTPVVVEDVSQGTVVSQANPVGVPVAVGLSPHVLAVLSRANGKIKLRWFDPDSGDTLGKMAVPASTAPVLAVSDQAIVFRVGRYLHALSLATGHARVVGKTAPAPVGLALDDARLVWAESSRTSGRIRALSVP